MRILSLDLSKSCTGWACWGPEDSKVRFSHWCLGSEFTPDGLVYANLHGHLSELHSRLPITGLFMEEALNPAVLQGRTTINTLRILSGLNAHAHSWGHQMGCAPIMEINQSSWRKTFLGAYPRGTRRDEFKKRGKERALSYGFHVSTDDESDAIGILTHACLSLKIQPYWLKDEVLRPELTTTSRRKV